MPDDASAMPWTTRTELERHFLKHRRELRVTSREQYLQSARDTIARGVRFTYEHKGDYRVGYFHRATRRFTAVTADGSMITHYAASERHVRSSTYN